MKNKKPKDYSKKKISETKLVMKLFVFVGTVFALIAAYYLMNYFFVKKNNIKINMSTDRQLKYVTIDGKEELISTQKYISDLGYSMRYDIERFRVLKYKEQDFYRYLDNDRVIVAVEKSKLPIACISNKLDIEYSSCAVKIDEFTEEYYISTAEAVYKITVKCPNSSEYEATIKARIRNMINTFHIN